jgi:hypothetical protein
MEIHRTSSSRLHPGQEVRLKGAFILSNARELWKNEAASVTEVHCTYVGDPQRRTDRLTAR